MAIASVDDGIHDLHVSPLVRGRWVCARAPQDTLPTARSASFAAWRGPDAEAAASQDRACATTYNPGDLYVFDNTHVTQPFALPHARH